MQKPIVQLEFVCSKKWSDMTPQGNGRFCGDCKKVVTDFTKPENLILLDTQQGGCGNFYAHQVNKPFNDWRDNIIAFCQKTTLRVTGNKLIKPITVFLLMILLVTTGCARKTRGMRGKFASIKSPNKTEQGQHVIKTTNI